MSKYGHEFSKTGNILITVAMVAVGMLAFVAFTQPAWRGEDMVRQMRANCDKAGGVMLETKGLMGITYECSPRLDKGLSND